MAPASNNHLLLVPTSSSSPAKKLKDLLSNGSFPEALSLFKHLHSSSIPIPLSLLPSLLKASPLPLALQLHSSLLKSNLFSHPVILNSLLSAYSAHSFLASARKLFDSAPHRDPVTWSSILLSYARTGHFSESLHLLRGMTSAGILPKPELLAAVVSLCGRHLGGGLRLGRAIHARSSVNSTLDRCVLLQTALVDMYSKCNDLRSALELFYRMPERNVVSWTAMVSGFVRCGRYVEGIDLVRRMGGEGVEPVRATAVAVLPACGGLEALKLGKEVHGFAYRHGIESESRIVAGLVSMYSKCRPGGIRLALLVFQRADGRDTITWSSMMEATSRAGHSVRTFELFGRMRRDGVKPNSVAMLAVVDACVDLASLDHGQAALGYVLKSGFLSDVYLGNSLINMFAKCGCVDSSARVFFELMPARDSISYGSMIQSYAFHGRGHDAIGLFEDMHASGHELDDVTLLALLSACNHSGLVAEAKKIFDSATNGDFGVGLNLEQYSCYVDLLGKAGMIEEAFEVVRRMPMKPSMRIQTSLASACRVHGKLQVAEEIALELIDLEPENAANYKLLSAIYAEGAKWDGVEQVRKMTRERGLRKVSGNSRI